MTKPFDDPLQDPLLAAAIGPARDTLVQIASQVDDVTRAALEGSSFAVLHLPLSST